MNSNLKNTWLACPESLQAAGLLIYMDETGAFIPSTVVIPVKNNRQYTINRIDLTIIMFSNPAVVPAAPAFPKWEQFALTLSLRGFLANQGSEYAPLFSELVWFTPDGISATAVFTEPFIFQTNDPRTQTNTLNIRFSNFGAGLTNISSLTGITVPPPAGEIIEVMGLVSLQGVSYDLKTAAALNLGRQP